ncbi:MULTISPECIES: flagellar basal-body MS-ring/collar protein FliF [unclassified Rhizobium]|uniref:flagellar basal-body MS-ring/collar protein FliF n=1 Tax=unclassified Rhizobium TaxID=2613769 RepID=UPI0006FA7E78|nr:MULTISPECIES: flagellar basal-body MS-ring/collar protein FliF [unclassified Rhizobium]KQV43907.1 flagellar M-ring protein FliF [Rhizobium sp. Root1212]KRD38088.1 flagellar M-ring protein FliF [Rhizobium sp. Root268]
MNLLDQLSSVTKNLASLGKGKLVALASAGIVAIGIVLAAGIYVNKPAYETLYVGLESSDLNQVSVALAEANIEFDVGPDGSSVQVPVGMTGKARLYLAERGLPNSANAGYELFDKVGSLGLTSFMQEVTRVRALEGEIARTIQQISGISAARVHIVMADRGSFRKAEQKPTASVMIRASATIGRNAAASIRHLVASSVPGLDIDGVTILDSSGQLLASGDDPANSAMNQSLSIVQSVQGEVESNIDKALAPFLGMDNFRASVTATLNTDSQQIQETVYDPESRVERSTRVTKEDAKSTQNQPDNAATVQQNVPQQAPQGGTGQQSSDQNQKKEEQTNYEINSKTVATTKNSYRVEKLSVAVVVNRGRIAAMVGEPADQAKMDAYIQEMQKIVASAVGLDAARGDVITLTAMDFVDTQLLDTAVAGPGIMETLTRNLGGIINALAFVAVAGLVVWMGMRPLARSLGIGGNGGAVGENEAVGLELPDFSPATGAPAGGALMEGFGSDFGFDSTDDLLSLGEGDDFNRRVKEGPERRLARMVEISEERAAKILRKWAAEKAA